MGPGTETGFIHYKRLKKSERVRKLRIAWSLFGGLMKKKPDSILALVFLFCFGLALNALVGMGPTEKPAENFAHMQLLDYQLDSAAKTANN